MSNNNNNQKEKEKNKPTIIIKPQYKKSNDTFDMIVVINDVEQRETIVEVTPEEFSYLRNEMYNQDQIREAIIFLKEQGILVVSD